MNISLSTAIHFDLMPVISPVSLVTVYEQKHRFLDQKKTKELFQTAVSKNYLVVLKLLLKEEVRTYAIFTGRFLEQIVLNSNLHKLLKKLLAKDLLVPVVDTYFGDSYSSFHHLDWWKDGVLKTSHKFTKIFDLEAKIVYLPQLFRGLALEKVVASGHFEEFLTPLNGKKFLEFETNLIDFRRFEGRKVPWIQESENINLKFKFLPEANFFSINGNLLQQDLNQASKTFGLAVAFEANEYEIKKSRKKIRRVREFVRFNEKPSISSLNDLQRAVYRLWVYGFSKLFNYLDLSGHDYKDPVVQDFLTISGREFLFFLDKSIYSDQNSFMFSSPYEAFMTVQAVVTKVELALQPK